MLGSNKAIELERAAWLLEGAALRLEVIDLRVIPLDSAAEGVLSSDPGQVSATDELLVAEQERVGGLRIAQGCSCGATSTRRRSSSGEDETREPVIQARVTCSARIVGSRNFQIVEPVGRSESECRTQPLAGETEVPIQQQRGGERVCHAKADVLDQAGSVAKLSAIGCVTDSGSEQRRIKDQRLGEAIATEDGGFRSGNIVNLKVSVVTVKEGGSAARPIVRAELRRKFLSEIRL